MEGGAGRDTRGGETQAEILHRGRRRPPQRSSEAGAVRARGGVAKNPQEEELTKKQHPPPQAQSPLWPSAGRETILPDRAFPSLTPAGAAPPRSQTGDPGLGAAVIERGWGRRHPRGHSGLSPLSTRSHCRTPTSGHPRRPPAREQQPPGRGASAGRRPRWDRWAGPRSWGRPPRPSAVLKRKKWVVPRCGPAGLRPPGVPGEKPRLPGLLRHVGESFIIKARPAVRTLG